MPRRGKKYIAAKKQIEPRAYGLTEAIELLKRIRYEKFNSSLEVSVDLNIDPRQPNQNVRGVVSLPHGTGKTVRILVLASAEKQKEAQEAGADYVGLEEAIARIEQGWVDYDVVVCTPDVMPRIARLGKILGPRGLMPNPKSGTVTTDMAKAVRELKAGKIEFRNDKTGVVHAAVGKMQFSTDALRENTIEFIKAVEALRPTSAKGNFITSIYLSTTMSPGILLDRSKLN
ncbi:MAG: 50S ribosomal protein L1 [Bacteroidia bacterium]